MKLLPDGPFEVFFLTGTDPYDNLAAEEALFEDLEPGKGVFLTYVNAPCVVLGKNQNPWREVNLPRLRQVGLPLLRRMTGGGTVVHDEGNLNFSFMMDKSHYNKDEIHAFMRESLEDWGIAAAVTDKGDYLWDGRKFSGNAMSFRRNKALHHGTLLVSSDLPRLRGVLGGLAGLDDAPGVKSRPMPVANLSEARSGLTVQALAGSLRLRFARAAGLDEDCVRPLEAGEKALRRGACRERLASPEWLWGQTPPFEWRFSHPSGVLSVRVEAGRVVSPAPVSEGGWFSPEEIEKYFEAAM